MVDDVVRTEVAVFWWFHAFLWCFGLFLFCCEGERGQDSVQSCCAFVWFFLLHSGIFVRHAVKSGHCPNTGEGWASEEQLKRRL